MEREVRFLEVIFSLEDEEKIVIKLNYEEFERLMENWSSVDLNKFMERAILIRIINIVSCGLEVRENRI